VGGRHRIVSYEVPAPELVAIRMPSSDRVEIYSGVARLAGKLWACRHRSPRPTKTAVVIVHPSSNFLGHYLLAPLAAAGVDAIGMNTRYIANDSMLLMENCLVDIGAAVAHLRDEGYERIVLLGNSGGGGLVAMYQSQATEPTIRATPAGDPPDLTSASLPPVDALVASMAHPGRAIVYTEWLDPAIVEEADPFRRDPTLDMFDARNGPPYAPEFVERYRSAQVARSGRIREWVRDRLDQLAADELGLVTDLPFVVHGTVADLRFADLTIDPSDRQVGTFWGEAIGANLSPASLGHHTSLRSWLSQWSIADSNCDGPWHLTRTDVPVLVLYGTADQVSFPSHARALADAVPDGNGTVVALEGADHYFTSTPELIPVVAARIVDWMAAHDLLA
jgi:pimeloyl-ACP methyl ester carboxylesterase